VVLRAVPEKNPHCKGDHSVCDNHRGISLLSVPGKILARVILNRLTKDVTDRDILLESQCGFRAGRGTMDMIFTAKQLQEKCRQHQCDLYAYSSTSPKHLTLLTDLHCGRF